LFCTLNFLLPLSGCQDLWSRGLTKLLTALAGNLRWKLLTWLPSVTSFPDGVCFDEQLQHKSCLTSRFLSFRVLILSLVLSGGKFIWKQSLEKCPGFPHLKQFPFVASVSWAGILRTLLPACMQHVC
jgi:hypothetical protein